MPHAVIPHGELVSRGDGGCLNVHLSKQYVGIINWQKRYVPTNDSKHLSLTTEYILIYAKRETQAETRLLARTERMNADYSNPDNDPEGDWRGSDLSARTIMVFKARLLVRSIIHLQEEVGRTRKQL